MLQFKKRKRPYGVEIPLTSMIDIVFLLLIYFLLTTNFLVDEGVKVNLPNAKALHDTVDTEIIIHIQRGGDIYLEKNLLSTAELLSTLRSQVASGQKPVVVVKADKDIIVNRVVAVMDIAKAAGVEKILLATEREL